MKCKRSLLKLHLRDPIFDELGPKAFGLLAEVHHQLRSLNAFGETRIILDIRGYHELATGSGLFLRVSGRIDQQRRQIRPGRVDGRSQSRGARTDDHHVPFQCLFFHLFCSRLVDLSLKILAPKCSQSIAFWVMRIV